MPQYLCEFRFPSNGNAQHKFVAPGSKPGRYISFDSLQTGIHIASQEWKYYLLSWLRVSIPFKRERTAQVKIMVSQADFPKFQVSIPFKRESTSKASEDSSGHPYSVRFPFPSNGKVMCITQQRHCQVFCFDSLQTGTQSTSEEVGNLSPLDERPEFRFPSNGKAHRKFASITLEWVRFIKFQFPSNGNAEPK